MNLHFHKPASPKGLAQTASHTETPPGHECIPAARVSAYQREPGNLQTPTPHTLLQGRHGLAVPALGASEVGTATPSALGLICAKAYRIPGVDVVPGTEHVARIHVEDPGYQILLGRNFAGRVTPAEIALAAAATPDRPVRVAGLACAVRALAWRAAHRGPA